MGQEPNRTGQAPGLSTLLSTLFTGLTEKGVPDYIAGEIAVIAAKDIVPQVDWNRTEVVA